MRVLVIPIWFAKGTVGTTDPTQGPWALPTERFERALTSDPGGSSARRWWAEASFGQVTLTGAVTPWIQVPLKAPSPTAGGLGSCGRQDYVDAAVAGAAARGYRHADFDQVVVIARASSCTISGVAGRSKDGVTPKSAATFLHATDSHETLVFLFAHELLHNLGLGHANATDCHIGVFRIPDAMDPSAQCVRREYEDHTSVMGRLDETSTPAHHPSAVEKAAVGWITEEAGDITEVPVSSLTTAWSRIVLHRSNVRGSGPILLRLDHDVEGGAVGETTVELRGRVAPTGSPAHTFEPMASVWGGSPEPWLSGTSIRSGFDLLDATPQTNTSTDAPLRPGAPPVITSPGGPTTRPWIGAVEIRTDAITKTTAVVSVRRPPSIAQPFEAAQACFEPTDPFPDPVTRLDLRCSVFAPQQRISVDWGDGTAPTVVEPPILTMPQLQHVYPADAARCFPITLRIEPASTSTPVSSSSKVVVRGRDGHPSCLASQTPDGSAVSQGAAPWVASIRAGTHHSCGGALVSPRWVLTSLSCIQRAFSLAAFSPAPMEVVVGSSSLGPEPATAEHHTLASGQSMAVNQPAGLVLLHLATASSVAPVTVGATPPATGAPIATLGWGDIQVGFDGWWPRSTNLRRTQLVVRPPLTCSLGVAGTAVAPTAVAGAEALSPASSGPSVMCAGPGTDGAPSRCAGDLGGPMVVPGTVERLVGVVDAAPGSGPGGFADPVCGSITRVRPLAPYAGWIAQQT